MNIKSSLLYKGTKILIFCKTIYTQTLPICLKLIILKLGHKSKMQNCIKTYYFLPKNAFEFNEKINDIMSSREMHFLLSNKAIYFHVMWKRTY